MTDDLTDDIIWKQGRRMPWFDTRLGQLEKEKKLYILYVYWVTNVTDVVMRTAFTSYILEPT